MPVNSSGDVRIGFDVSQTGREKAGCGFAAHGLVRGLAAIDGSYDFLLYGEFGDHRLEGEPPVTLGRRFRMASLEEGFGSVDVVHANNFHCPLGLEQKLVYTLYDLSFLTNPEWTTEANRIACFEGVFKASLWSDFIVAISEASQQHFLEIFPHFPAERTAVVPLASRFEADLPLAVPSGLERADELAATRGFLLCVGTLEPRKNHRRLLAAYESYRRRRGEQALPLVIVGGEGWLTGDLGRQIAAADGVHRLGYVDDAELLWLYRHCRLFVYPSLFEGFGLPVLEAMGQGAPIVASKTTSLPEVAGEAGALIDPLDEQAMAWALDLAHDAEQLEAMSRRSLERAAGYSWRRSAEHVLSIYQLVLEEPKLYSSHSRPRMAKVVPSG